jgi:uncharacterized protein
VNHHNAASFGAGALFSLGLALSGMLKPGKVIAFLDVAGGHWDPSLALVMGGAIAVAMPFFMLAARRPRPLFDGQFHPPTRTRIDAPLRAGAVLFGAGWGLSGYCPGPALLSVFTFAPAALVFVATMLLGMALHDRYPRTAGLTP